MAELDEELTERIRAPFQADLTAPPDLGRRVLERVAESRRRRAVLLACLLAALVAVAAGALLSHG